MKKYTILIFFLLSSIVRLNGQVIDLSKIILAPLQICVREAEPESHNAIRLTTDSDVKKQEDVVIEAWLLCSLLSAVSPQGRGSIIPLYLIGITVPFSIRGGAASGGYVQARGKAAA
jgi:hypothetical protein